MAPVHQGIAPTGFTDIAVGPLRQVAMDIADHFTGVMHVVIAELGVLFAQQFNAAPA